MSNFLEQLESALPDLWRYAFALTRDGSAADDLVQDCAERALRKRRLWNRRRDLRPWLTTMMLNVFRNQYRRGRAYRMVPFDPETMTEEVLPAAEARIDLERLLLQVSALPDDQREVLLLVTVAGLSYDEAATALGIPRGTVMSRLSRARGRLRMEDAGPARLRSVR